MLLWFLGRLTAKPNTLISKAGHSGIKNVKNSISRIEHIEKQPKIKKNKLYCYNNPSIANAPKKAWIPNINTLIIPWIYHTVVKLSRLRSIRPNRLAFKSFLLITKVTIPRVQRNFKLTIPRVKINAPRCCATWWENCLWYMLVN